MPYPLPASWRAAARQWLRVTAAAVAGAAAVAALATYPVESGTARPVVLGETTYDQYLVLRVSTQPAWRQAGVTLGLVGGVDSAYVAQHRRFSASSAAAAYSVSSDGGEPDGAPPPPDRVLVPGNEHGPSSGLVHALALLDESAPGDLTGGRRIAATGSVTRGGDVGIVDGVDAKLAAAVAQGADVVFVPARQAPAARAVAAGRVSVIGVSTVADAVAALCQTGGTSPHCP
jgi:hypothetical protein